MKRNVPRTARKVYSTAEVARIAGVSRRQLQWWDERRVIPVRHVGHNREYEEFDLLQISVLAQMRRKGLSLQVIRRGLRRLQRELGTEFLFRPEENMWLLIGAGTATAPMVHGGQRWIKRGSILALTNSREELTDLLVKHEGAVIVVSVSAQAWKSAA